MFRFTQEQSSGNYNECLSKITGLVQQCNKPGSVVWNGSMDVDEERRTSSANF